MKKEIHPGRLLADLLAKQDLSANKLATALDMPTNRITSIVRGDRAVTPGTALKLARFFPDLTAEQWLELQMRHDLAVARRARLTRGAKFTRRDRSATHA
jgi:addiction module HigA family antidote